MCRKMRAKWGNSNTGIDQKRQQVTREWPEGLKKEWLKEGAVGGRWFEITSQPVNSTVEEIDSLVNLQNKIRPKLALDFDDSISTENVVLDGVEIA